MPPLENRAHEAYARARAEGLERLEAYVEAGYRGGRGAAAINSLMEDAATAEISRSQIWQWVHHGSKLADGRTVTAELVREVLDQETAKIREQVGEKTWSAGRPDETREIFEQVALSEELLEFLTHAGEDRLFA